MIRPLLASLALGALVAGCAAPSVDIPEAPTGISSPAVAPAAAPAKTTRDSVPVLHVVDGDTFDVPEGRVRVLVMDSCERGTDGGRRATVEAHELLDGARVVLTAEPGHDRDRYDRLLRYVQLEDGRDYAEAMLRESHTGVYAKKSDASDERTAHGRDADTDGRDCGSSTKATPAAATTSSAPSHRTAKTSTTRTTTARPTHRVGSGYDPTDSRYQGADDPGTAAGRAPTSGETQLAWLCSQGMTTEGC